MSIKTNTTDLQAVLEAVNNLPEATTAENLDEELATQDTLIADIMTALDGKSAGGASGTNILTFAIDVTEYQAEEGMTWVEWYESDYNTSNGEVTVTDYGVSVSDELGSYAVYYTFTNGGLMVDSQEPIISNHDYHTE